MAMAHIQQGFQKLSGSMKLVGIGSIVLTISTFLPWYADLDAFQVGDMFLGVTGPASFVGIGILLLSLGSFGIFMAHLLEKRVFKLPVKESAYHLFVGIESLFLLFIVNSIYFHTKFGVNINLKESRFGMLLALISAAVITVGGYYELKMERKTEDYIGKLEPLIQVKPEFHAKPAPVQPKPMPAMTTRSHQPIMQRQGMVERAQEELLAQKRMPNAMSQMPKPVIPQTPTASPSSQTPEKSILSSLPQEPKSSSGEGSYMIRMDL